jgi:LAO/AO transport system kinase
MADHVVINKADGDNRLRAERARAEQGAALHYMQSSTPDWKIDVGLCSALTGEGVPQIWEKVEQFYAAMEAKGLLAERRQRQLFDWMNDLIYDELRRRFEHDRRVLEQIPAVRQALLRGEITAVRAAQILLETFDRRNEPAVTN